MKCFWQYGQNNFRVKDNIGNLSPPPPILGLSPLYENHVVFFQNCAGDFFVIFCSLSPKGAHEGGPGGSRTPLDRENC